MKPSRGPSDVEPPARGDIERTRHGIGTVKGGEGAYAIDQAGRRYIDAMSNRSQLGYSYGAELAEAARAGEAPGADPIGALRSRLAALAPGDLDEVVFTTGAFESLEVTWTLARRHFEALGERQRRKAIVRRVAIHGVALSALSFNGVSPIASPLGPAPISVVEVSNTNAFRTGFEPGDPAFAEHLLRELEEVVQAEGPRTIAVIVVEPVQMGGGCLVPPPGYWEGLRALADRHGILIVADDSATDFGRLGEWYGFERFGGVPDMATCGTGLTSSYVPLGAVVVREALRATCDPRTYARVRDRSLGGSRAGAAAALRCIDIIERDGLLERVRTGEPVLAARLEELKALPAVGDVRGMGYFWAVELVRPGSTERLDEGTRELLLHEYLPARLSEAGLIARVDDRGDPVVMLAPPLISDVELLETIVDRLADVLRDAGAFIAARP
jgi:adenosylmethionine-8-amino-7-oxononanoate aminotransferase